MDTDGPNISWLTNIPCFQSRATGEATPKKLVASTPEESALEEANVLSSTQTKDLKK